MLLIDKYRPSTKDESCFHKEILEMLEIMSKDNAIPHTIFHGCDGVGKRTLINIFLGMMFGKGAKNIKEVSYEIVSSGGKKTPEKIRQSNYHIEINPKGTNYDKYLIHEIVKEYAKNKSINVLFEDNKKFKLVLINNVDNLSPVAQMALRRTMEVYSDKCRFILWCQSLSKLIKELQSRCIKLCVSSPMDDEIFVYLAKISIYEKIDVSFERLCEIVKKSQGNIKHGLWELEYIKHGYTLNTEYINTIGIIVDKMVNCNFENLKIIKDLLSNLTITNFTGQTILKDIIDKICDYDNISDEKKQKIINKSAEIDYRFIKKRRESIHFNAFILYAVSVLMS